MLHRTLPIAVLGLLMGSGFLAAAEEWSQWRGPKRDGYSTDTGLLPTFPAAGPQLLWKATDLGHASSSVAVSKGKLYTMGEADGGSCVFCLDVATGKTVWTGKIGKLHKDGGPACTPTVDGAQVFTIGGEGEVAALDLATGKEQWHKEMMADLGSKGLPRWAYCESPLVDGDRVCVTPGGPKGTLAALNRKTGELIWQSKEVTDDAQYSSIVIATICGVRQYVQFTGNSVFGVEPETGKLLWRAIRGGSTAMVATPIVKDDCVYVTSAYEVGCNMFKITAAGGKMTATQVYANKEMCNQHGNVILIGDCVYGASDGKGLVCMEFKTGKVMWIEKSVGKGSAVYADGHLYYRTDADKGTIWMIKPSAEGFKLDGKFDPKLSNWVHFEHPVISGGQLYLHDGTQLLCYDIKAK